MLVSWFKFEHLTQKAASNEIPGKTPTDFTGNETNWKNRAPVRVMNHCHSHPAEFVRMKMRYCLKALLLVFHVTRHFFLFCKIIRKVFYYLQVTNWRGWMSHWGQFWAGLARRLQVSWKVHPNLPFLLHNHSQNNVAVLNIAMLCSFNKRRFLQGAQATTFVKISTSIWDVILA